MTYYNRELCSIFRNNLNGERIWERIDTCTCACMPSRFSPVQLFATLLAVAGQVPLSMGFSKREYWSGLPFSPPGDPPYPGIESTPPALQMDSLPLSHWGSPLDTCMLPPPSRFSRVWLFATPWIDHSLPVSSVHGIFQARVLEWVAIFSSRGSSWLRDGTCISWVSCIAGGFFIYSHLRSSRDIGLLLSN